MKRLTTATSQPFKQLLIFFVRLMKFTLATIFSLFFIGSYGYQLSDSVQFEIYIEKAVANPDRALHYYAQAERLNITPLQKIRINRLIAEIHFELGKFDSAQNRLTSHSGLLSGASYDGQKLELAKNHLLQGKIHLESFEHDAAAEELMKAVKILEDQYDDSKELHVAYFYIGKGYRQAYRLNEAKFWIEKALDFALAKNLAEETHRSYAEMGLIYHHEYQPKLSREYLKLGLLTLDRHNISGEANYRLITHNNIAMTFDNEQYYDSAIFHYMSALSLTEVVPLNDYTRSRYRAGILNNIASVYFGKEDFRPAISYAQKSLDVYESYLGKDHIALVSPLRNLGESLRDVGEYKAADIHLKRALDLSKRNDDLFGSINTYNALALNHVSQDESQMAKDYCDSAIAANTYLLNDRDEYYDYSNLFYSQYIYSIAISIEPDLRTVDSVYHELKSSIFYVQNKLQHPQTSSVIPSSLEKLYQSYHVIFEQTKNDLCLQRMWEITELNKAIKLRNQLKSEHSLTFSIPEELLLNEKKIQDSINMILSVVEPNTFDSALFFLNREYDALISQIESEYPKYLELKNKSFDVSLTERQTQLGENEAHLSFLEGVDSVYLITLHTNRINQTAVGKDSIRSLIKQFNHALINHDAGQIIKHSQQIMSIFRLDQLLREEIDRMTLVPDGIIWKLNFAALTYLADGKPRYFGNEIVLAYHYYSHPDRLERGTKQLKEVLAFSHNEIDEKTHETNYVAFRNLSESLPGSSKEVMAISEQWEGDYYFAKAANESVFKEQSENYSILHLAVHGFMDENYPENSYLKFASSDSVNDGKLHAYELYNLDLNADLAVVTACNSGEGKIESGEGMMSIGRAFAYAGVESLLASRWDVPDVSAPPLMKYFYSGLKQGMLKSEALQFAQKKYLANDADNITSAPFYWAGFYVIGDDCPIRSKPQNPIFILAIVVFSAALVFLMVKKYQSNSSNSS